LLDFLCELYYDARIHEYQVDVSKEWVNNQTRRKHSDTIHGPSCDKLT
jgi:hypothetical protein